MKTRKTRDRQTNAIHYQSLLPRLSWSAGVQRRRRGKTCLILIQPRRLLNNLPPHLLQSILVSLLLLKSSPHLLLSHLGVLGVQRTHFLKTAPPPLTYFSRAILCSLLPPQRGHVLQPSAHLKAAIASLSPLLLPAKTSQDSCLSGVPACTILFQCFCVYTPSFRDQYCLQITIKLKYLKISWLYDQTYMTIAWRSIFFC